MAVLEPLEVKATSSFFYLFQILNNAFADRSTRVFNKDFSRQSIWLEMMKEEYAKNGGSRSIRQMSSKNEGGIDYQIAINSSGTSAKAFLSFNEQYAVWMEAEQEANEQLQLNYLAFKKFVPYTSDKSILTDARQKYPTVLSVDTLGKDDSIHTRYYPNARHHQQYRAVEDLRECFENLSDWNERGVLSQALAHPVTWTFVNYVKTLAR